MRRIPLKARLALAAGLALSYAFWRCLPAPLFKAPFSPVLFSREGELLDARVAQDGQWRFPPGGPVPARFKEALVRREDRRFYSHPGADPLALARAFARNLGRGRTVSGGSTLTMQVIRMSRGNPGRTYAEKLVEILLALRLELGRTKEEVLALYAAHAPFGENVVGFEAAAWRYFGRRPEQLSWAESCILAVLPNNPSLIHPGRNRRLLKARRDRLLASLRSAGRLDALEFKLAFLEPLPAAPRPFPHLAPHLLETLLRRRPGAGPRFETTLSRPAQQAAQDIVARRSAGLALRGIRDAAALVVDGRDNSVLAYVGNSSPLDCETPGCAVDIVQRPRSTGSLLKPFLYAAMLQAGELLPSTLVPDVPTEYDGFMPENSDRRYRGAVPAREALARSLNVPAVRLLREHGVARFHAFLKRMGMTTLFRPADDYGLSLVLGGAEGTLWDLTGMYANLAWLARGNARAFSGRYAALRVLKGDPVASGGRAEIGPGAAWLALQALVEVARPEDEAHWRNFASSRRVAWKTGTSFGYRDGWAVGADGRHVAGVWTGNASGEGRPELTGTAAAAPVLFELLNRLKAPAEWFPAPVYDLKRVEACKGDGFLPSAGCELEAQWTPADAHFERSSPHHVLVHLDPSGARRVHGGCESVARMTARTWFVLPPGIEHFYRRRHPEYRPLVPYRADCRGLAPEGQQPISLLYPHQDTKLYIPLDLDGKKGKVVFEAVHRDPAAVLYWHLDGSYLGLTRAFHHQALDIPQGVHRVTVVDGLGNRLSRRFEVLGPR